MERLAKVVSPLSSVGEREGVELILVSVEVWPDEVVVRMRGRPSSETEQLEGAFADALEQWHRDGREGRPPDQPAERIFGLDVRVSDDAGTPYRAFSSARGGSGTMFRADWTFVPGPPDNAGLLTVNCGEDAQTEVDLRSA